MAKPSLSPDIVNNPFLNFLVNPSWRIYRHLLPLLLLLLFFQTGKNEYQGNSNLLIGVGVSIFFISHIYINMYVLIPRLLFRNKYIPYFAAVVILIVLSFFLLILTDHFVLTHYRILPKKEDAVNLWQGMFAYTFMFCIAISASTAVKLFQRWVVDSHRINEMGKMKLQSELDLLKSQINPHFLFNMLNNANVLTYTNPLKASQVLMKLSDLLRYQLYDSTRDKVLLTSEIHFLTDLLDLETTRRDRFEYFISREGNINSVMVPPLFFVIFVENALKHNVDVKNASYVQLFFEVGKQGLFFKCVNSKPASRPAGNGSGGLGLANVKRRLELLYPGAHEMNVHEDTTTYTVTLTIPV